MQLVTAWRIERNPMDLQIIPYFKWTSLMFPFKVIDVDLKLPKTRYIHIFIQRCVSCFKTKFALLLDTKIVDKPLLMKANLDVFLLKTAEEKQRNGKV